MPAKKNNPNLLKDLDSGALSGGKRPSSSTTNNNKSNPPAAYTFNFNSSSDEEDNVDRRNAAPNPKSPPRTKSGGAAAADAPPKKPADSILEGILGQRSPSIMDVAKGQHSDTEEDNDDDQPDDAVDAILAAAATPQKNPRPKNTRRVLRDDEDDDEDDADDILGAAAAGKGPISDNEDDDDDDAVADGYTDDRHHRPAAKDASPPPRSPSKDDDGNAEGVGDSRPYLQRHNSLHRNDDADDDGGGYPRRSFSEDGELIPSPITPGRDQDHSYRWPSSPRRAPPPPPAPAAVGGGNLHAEHEALRSAVLKLAKNYNTFKTRAERALTDQARAYDIHIQEERRARRGLRDKQIADESNSQQLIRAVAKGVTDCRRAIRELARRIDTLAAGEVYDAPPRQRSKSPSNKRRSQSPRRGGKKAAAAIEPPPPAPQPQQDELALLLDGPRPAAARPARSAGMSTRSTKVTNASFSSPFTAAAPPHDALRSLIMSAQRLHEPSHADLDAIASRVPRVPRITYTTSACFCSGDRASTDVHDRLAEYIRTMIVLYENIDAVAREERKDPNTIYRDGHGRIGDFIFAHGGNPPTPAPLLQQPDHEEEEAPLSSSSVEEEDDDARHPAVATTITVANPSNLLLIAPAASSSMQNTELF